MLLAGGDMAEIYRQRMTVEMAEDFVVFLIGMRINRPWKIHKWLPVALSMQKMIKELSAQPELGLLHVESWFGRTSIMIQYWRSFELLESYSHSRDAKHLPAWAEFNRRVGSNGDVGIWHETYRAGQGCYECIYHNMPRFGLAKVGEPVPALNALSSARGRMYDGLPDD
jgi:hypothetical protein